MRQLKLIFLVLGMGILSSCGQEREDTPDDAGQEDAGGDQDGDTPEDDAARDASEEADSAWSELEMGPEGGTLKFDNGTVIDFPPGSVEQSTSVALADLPRERVEAIVSRPTSGEARSKRVLAAFSTKPDGLTFKQPVWVSLPIAALEPRSIPLPVTLDLDAGTYAYSGSRIEYDPDAQKLRFELSHFSDHAILEAIEPAEDPVCNTCGAVRSAECEALDPLQGGCCLLPRQARSACGMSCDCCREGRIRVETKATDLSNEECQLLNDEVSITFLDCAGQPTETDSPSESTCTDLDLSLRIAPPSLTLSLGGTSRGEFKALLHGKRGERTIFNEAEVLATWTSAAPESADFVGQLGSIQGHKASVAPVSVRAKWGDAGAAALVNVTCDVCKLQLTAARSYVLVQGVLPLTARLRDPSGAEVAFEPNLVSWRIGNSQVAGLSSPSGESVDLLGLRDGKADITATYTDVGTTLTATLTVEVTSGHSADASAIPNPF